MSFNKIFILLSLSLLFGLTPTKTAAEVQKISLDGATYHPFILDCRSPDTFDTNHGIIVPNGVSKIDKIYIHFHGLSDSPHVNIQDIVTKYQLGQKVEAMKQKGTNVAIIIPELNPHSGNWGSKYNRTNIGCFINGALSELNKLVSQAPSSIAVASGHSAGGGVLKSYFSSGFSASESTILLDACYPGWCPSITQSGNTGKVYIYYRQGTDTETGSMEAYNAAKDKTVIYKVNTSHEGVARSCLIDHYLNDKCGGIAELVGGEAGVSGSGIQVTKIESDILIGPPKLSIKIPELNFSELQTVIKESGGNSYLYIPWIGQYIAAIYKFGLAVASILAVIIIIMQGVTIVISGGGEEKNSAYKRIGQVLVGLMILWGSYAIMYTINPELVQFQSLKILYIEGIPLGEDESPEQSQESNMSVGASSPASVESIVPQNNNLCFPIKKIDIKDAQFDSFGNFRGPLKDSSAPTYRCHAGNDILTNSEANVYAIDKGTITAVRGSFSRCEDNYKLREQRGKTTKDSTEGYAIFIYHPDIDMTINYGEIDYDQSKYKIGDKDIEVQKGEYLGKVGYCGMLHVEVYKGKFAPSAGSIYWRVPAEGTSSFLVAPDKFKTMSKQERKQNVTTALQATFKEKCRTAFIKYANGSLLDPKKLFTEIASKPCAQ